MKGEIKQNRRGSAKLDFIESLLKFSRLEIVAEEGLSRRDPSQNHSEFVRENPRHVDCNFNEFWQHESIWQIGD
jgi:hypothetical protein